MKSPVLISGTRTPIGSFMGGLASLSAPQLGAQALLGVINKANINSQIIDEVIIGQVLQGGTGQAPARQAALYAGLSDRTPATTVNKVCGSGLKAVMLAAQEIMLGHSGLVCAGGMESMSNAPYFLPKARAGMRMGDQAIKDLMINDGLWDPYGKSHMGTFGDLCALEFGFSREKQDEYAKNSYEKALKAQEKNIFAQEITSIEIKNKKKEPVKISQDEEPSRFRPEKMAQLKPVFSPKGTITAFNASKINDGAAMLVVAEENLAKKKNLKIAARILGYATYAHEPKWFTTAPVFAIEKALKICNLKIQDINLFEINEAFSVVPMVCIKKLDLDAQKVNIFGGAVALGHPIGCSGARILVTLVNALSQTKSRFGVASLCLGGGEAVAMVIENAGL